MNLRHRVSIFVLFLVAAMAGGLIVTSYVVINRVIISQNTTSFARELANFDFNIRQSNQELHAAGLIGLTSYVEAEKKRLIDLIRGYNFGKTGQLLVLDRDGKVILHPTIARGESFSSSFAGQVRGNQSGSLFYDQDGKRYFAAYQNASHWGWLLVMGVTEEELFETREFYITVSSAVCVIALFFVGIFSMALWRGIRKRINETLVGLRAVEQGNLESRLTVLSDDEIGLIQQGINDMTERLQGMISELSDNRAKYHDLYENSPDYLMSVDVTTRSIVECNSRVPELLRIPREKIIGRRLIDMYDESSREPAQDAFKALVQNGEVHGVELTVKRDDSSTFGVLLDAAGFYDADGQLQFVRCSWADISQRIEVEKRLQEANQHLAELDRMKSMFIASVSHELRTPLNAIIGFSGMILDGLSGELNEEQRDGMGRVNRAGKHLLSLISDVVDISKIEAGRIDRVLERFSLEDVVNEAIDNVIADLKSKGLDLIVDAPAWPSMYSDRKHLLQCLLNYLSNAVKFTETGSITFSVREVDERVHISVTDTGIGIAQEDISKLFEPFERVESTLQVKAGGTGLGLYLVKKLAAIALEGEVSVESQLKKGSVFSLHLPAEIKVAEQNNAEERAVSANQLKDKIEIP
jgi:PAS domain S-box-containing protein